MREPPSTLLSPVTPPSLPARHVDPPGPRLPGDNRRKPFPHG